MSKTTLAWADEIKKRQESLLALRRDFHKHPELSMKETRTAEVIAGRVRGGGVEAARERGDEPGVVDLQTVQAWADPRTLVTASKKDGPVTAGNASSNSKKPWPGPPSGWPCPCSSPPAGWTCWRRHASPSGEAVRTPGMGKKSAATSRVGWRVWD